MTKLLACRCGGEPFYSLRHVDGYGDSEQVTCSMCGITTGGMYAEGVAVKVWNERAPDPRLLKAIEEIEEATEKQIELYGQEYFTGKADSVTILNKHIPKVKDE